VKLAYIAGKKLHRRGDAGPAETVESRFAQAVRQRTMEMEQRHSWKTQGRGAQFMSGGALWGERRTDGAEAPAVIAGVAGFPGSNSLVYSLQTPDISGIFLVDEGGERRLFHTADFRVGRLSASRDRIAFVLQKASGSSIAMMERDGAGFVEVTQGDTIDDAPSWVPGSSSELVFHSAGVGRDSAGMVRGWGPAGIQKLNLESGEMTTLAEAADADLLSPRMSPDGTLYYIRRPYGSPRAGFVPGRALLDFVLLPFRILFALFQYLNFFSARYTGRTLTSHGAAQREADLRQMMIWGNLLKAQQTGHGQDDREKGLAPSTWCLMRGAPAGAPETVARGVLCFDLAADGSLLYSDGASVFQTDSTGASQRLLKDALIEQVAVVGEL
jgi:hypothetical protein